METYLSTEAAAAYLGIKERKLYELVATGAVPCDRSPSVSILVPEGFFRSLARRSAMAAST